MKNTFIISIILLLCSFAAAQNTVVTATVVDPTGTAVALGTVSATYQRPPLAGATPNIAGVAINENPTPVQMDGTGTFTITLADLSLVAPGGGKWFLTVSPFATTASTSIIANATTIHGPSVNLSAFINAAMPNMVVAATTQIPKAYNNAEVQGSAGSTWIDLTSNVLKYKDALGVIHSLSGGAPCGIASSIQFYNGGTGILDCSSTFTYNSGTNTMSVGLITTTGNEIIGGSTDVTADSTFRGSLSILGRTTSLSYNKVMQADSCTGADIAAQITDCCNKLPSNGGAIHIAAGIYPYNSGSITNCNGTKDVIIYGDGDGSLNLAGYGTMLKWTGGASPAISITGGNVSGVLSNFGIENTGTGTKAIDIEGTNNFIVEKVNVFPSVGFSVSCIDVGTSTNTVDTTLRDTYCRGNSAGLRAYNVSAHLVLDHARFIQNGVANTTPNVQLGDATHTVTSFHSFGSTFEGDVDIDEIKIIRCVLCNIDSNYFEFGQSSVTPAHGYAINVDTDAVQARRINVNKNYFAAVADLVHTKFLANLNFAPADISFADNYSVGLINPSNFLRNQSSSNVVMTNNTLSDTGSTLTSSNTNVSAMDNYSTASGRLANIIAAGTTFNSTVTVTGATQLNGSFGLGSLGTTYTQMYSVAGAITPAAVNANTCAEQTFNPAAMNTVVNAGDQISITTSATMAANGVFPAGSIRAVANGIAITYCNSTAGPLTPPAVTVTVRGNRQ